MEYIYYGITDIGKIRQTNEDNIYCYKNQFDEILLLLLDGMGGHKKGDVASKLAIDYFSKMFINRKKAFKNKNEQKKWLVSTLKNTNNYIFKIANNSIESKGMGTTFVGVLIANGFAFVINVGDSRCYIMQNNELKQVTKDDTYANLLLDNHEITQEQYDHYDKKNVLTNALGVYDQLICKVDELINFQKIVLCSDGLYNFVTNKEILNTLKLDIPLKNKCLKLIDLANSKGGKDNIGVLICEVR